MRYNWLIAPIVLIGWGTGAPAFPKLPALDLYGDPLPNGAIARLGTVKLRAGCSSLAFSPDGKKLIGVDDRAGVDGARAVREWDAKDGRLLGTICSADDRQECWLSDDGRTLVIVTNSRAEAWDTASRKKLDLPLPRNRTNLGIVCVSNDRRWVLVAIFEMGLARSPVEIELWDTASGNRRNLSKFEITLPSFAFSPDGKRCVCAGSPGVRVWDTSSGKLLWQVTHCNALDPHFTADGRYLIVAPRWRNDHWCIWDVGTGEEAKDLHPPSRYAWKFDTSPDGTQLLLPTEADYILWDMKAGRELQRWPGANWWGRGVFAPDGRTVVTYDTVLRRWDIATGKNLYADVSSLGHTAAVQQIFFSGDGKRLISVGGDRTARVWEIGTSKLIRTVHLGSARIDTWATTPDAGTLVGVDERLVLRRWSLNSDRPPAAANLREAQKLDIGLTAREIHMAPDGSLAMLAWPRSTDDVFNRFNFSFWVPTTGRLLRWGADPGQQLRGDYTRLSPDGRLVCSGDAIIDTRTATRRTIPPSPFNTGGLPTFSPDGRFVAVSSAGLRVWEVATGRVIIDLPRGSGGTDTMAFSPDGRLLAALGTERLVIWDIAAAKPVAEYSAGPVTGGLAFSPDGRSLAAGHVDGTILLWKVPLPADDEKWSDSDAASLWNDLGDVIPANAYAAVWQLARRPGDAVRLLKAKYPLIPAVPSAEWKKLIGALDSGRFAEREAASKRLRELGRPAVMPLRQALKDGPSPEQTRRIEGILADLEPPAGRPHGEDLRAVRAVAVLEGRATDEAVQLLKAWADRGPSPRLADEAARAVERLKWRH